MTKRFSMFESMLAQLAENQSDPVTEGLKLRILDKVINTKFDELFKVRAMATSSTDLNPPVYILGITRQMWNEVISGARSGVSADALWHALKLYDMVRERWPADVTKAVLGFASEQGVVGI